MKKIILLLLLLTLLKNYTFSQKLSIGFGSSFDNGISFKETVDYVLNEPENTNAFSLISMNVFLKIPLKEMINITPIAVFSIADVEVKLENKAGVSVKPGLNTITKVHSLTGNGENNIAGGHYLYPLADGEIQQKSFGVHITKKLGTGNGFEIGSGFLIREKTEKIESYMAIDNYVFSSSDLALDYYNYLNTVVDSNYSTTEQIKINSFTVPIILQYTFSLKHFFFSVSAIQYVGSNSYFSLGINTGFAF